MIRNNKWKLLISSLLILLPMALGPVLGKLFPETVGAVLGSRRIFFLLMPPVLLMLHWICLFFSLRDPGNRGQSKKAVGLVFWLCPAISLFTSIMAYLAALGKVSVLMSCNMLFTGLLFIVIGNYLPKCKRNSTIGIKVPWAMENDENWNATHRFGGKLWAAGGLVIIVGGLLPGKAMPFVLLPVIVLLAVVPAGYSYLYYRKSGSLPKPPVKMGRGGIAAAVISCVIAAAVLLFVFSGGYQIEYGETGFFVDASGWDDLSVSYEDIESISFRETPAGGLRTWGFGGPTVQMGTFENEDYGSYTRYTYSRGGGSVVLSVNGKTVVLSGKDPEATEAIYRELVTRISGK